MRQLATIHTQWRRGGLSENEAVADYRTVQCTQTNQLWPRHGRCRQTLETFGFEGDKKAFHTLWERGLATMVSSGTLGMFVGRKDMILLLFEPPIIRSPA